MSLKFLKAAELILSSAGISPPVPVMELLRALF
jgi:hypothetical protein